METTRQQKIGRLVQKELAPVFNMEARNHYHGSLITVTRVTVTTDLSIARVYLSIFATGTNTPEQVFDSIVRRTKEIRSQLGTAVRYQLRIIPNLEFFLDDSLDYIENIDNLLKQ